MGRKNFEDDIARELRRRRPSPTDGYVRSLAASVRPRPSVRTGRRLAVAFALSMLGVLALAITTGTAQPLAAPTSVASVVKKAVSTPKPAAAVPQRAATRIPRTAVTDGVAAAETNAASAASVETVTQAPTAATAARAKVGTIRPLTTAVALVDESPANDQYLDGEGCTPGFWKNHPEAFPSGVTAGDTLASVGFVGTGTITFDQALTEGGGGVDALLRHAAAAYLNALSVDYPLTGAQVVSMTNDAIASGNAATIESLEDTFDGLNNAGAAGFCD